MRVVLSAGIAGENVRRIALKALRETFHAAKNLAADRMPHTARPERYAECAESECFLLNCGMRLETCVC